MTRFGRLATALLLAASCTAAPALSAAAAEPAPPISAPIWDPGTAAWWTWTWDGTRWIPTSRWDGHAWVRVTGQPAGRPAPAQRHNAAFTDPAGTTSTYHLLGQPNAVTGLLVYLDGDDMNGYDNPDSSPLGGPNGIVETAQARGYLTLAIRTPAGDGTFWRDPDRNTAYVAALTQAVAAETGATRIAWAGFSGGSQLISKHLLPQHPELCTSVALLTGGGGQPPAPVTSTSSCPIVWATGTDDTGATSDDGYDALTDARRGQAAYAAAGWATAITTPAGIDHLEIRRQLGILLAPQLDHAIR